ncbi:Hypothetical Protein RSKD131_1975 [Cereibacter sphaeroides KD131]|nr:Hypothetical Protein RSKD131_1975 [Cereibacter sphaeroides KD131]
MDLQIDGQTALEQRRLVLSPRSQEPQQSHDTRSGQQSGAETRVRQPAPQCPKTIGLHGAHQDPREHANHRLSPRRRRLIARAPASRRIRKADLLSSQSDRDSPHSESSVDLNAEVRRSGPGCIRKSRQAAPMAAPVRRALPFGSDWRGHSVAAWARSTNGP